MGDISQNHLNDQLQQYCILNGGIYSKVMTWDKNLPKPKQIDLDRIIVQKKGKDLIVYWNENGEIKEKSLKQKKIREIMKLIPHAMTTSKNLRLISELVKNSECSLSLKNSFIKEDGNCNGWSFLYAYYVSIGREREFEQIREYIAKWDGRDKYPKLEKPLKEMFPGGGYDVLRQTVNDLVWFQFTNNTDLLKGTSKANLRHDERAKQYEILSPADTFLSDISGVMGLYRISDDDFINMMNFFSSWRGGWVDIRINIAPLGKHAISAYITEEGKFKYFDSNYSKFLPTSMTAQECLSLMHEINNEIFPGSSTTIEGISLHKFHHGPNPELMREHVDLPPFEESTAKILLKNAVQAGQNEFIALLLEEYIPNEICEDFLNEIDILSELSARSNKKTVDLLVSHGAQVNKLSQDKVSTPLLRACDNSNTEVVNALIKRGANVNMPNGMLRTPLHVSKNKQIIRKLLVNGADINAVDMRGQTPLHLAAIQKNAELVEALIEEGKNCNIDINATDLIGNTPLHYIAQKRSEEHEERLNQNAIIRQLRNAGADIQSVNNKGETPFDMANNTAAKKALRSRVLERKREKKYIPSYNLQAQDLQLPLKVEFTEIQNLNLPLEVKWSEQVVPPSSTRGEDEDKPIVPRGQTVKEKVKQYEQSMQLKAKNDTPHSKKR